MITGLLFTLSEINNFLPHLIAQMGNALYLVLFLLIFCETGLVFMPFLPGDSILFLCGSLAASENYHLSINIMLITLILASVLGDNINFLIGQKFGNYIFNHHKLRNLIKPEHVKKANKFFQKYGELAIFTGRFIPIIRTIVPFIAGINKMEINKFRKFNLLGGSVWVIMLLMSGYFIGNIPLIKNHIELLMFLIIIISLIPVIITFIKEKNQKNEK